MNVAFAMVVTKNYAHMALVALRSLRINSGYDVPCYIFCSNEKDHLRIDGVWDEINAIYPKAIMHEVDADKYRQNGKGGWPHYWSHEAFSIEEPDRIIFSDADVICMKNITDIPTTVELGMVWEKPRKQYFAGFFVLGKQYRNKETYEKILQHQKNPATFGRDQAVYNEFFEKEEITCLPNQYTIVTNYDHPDIRMLHYIYKPGQGSSLSEKYYTLWQAHASRVDDELKQAGIARKSC